MTRPRPLKRKPLKATIKPLRLDKPKPVEPKPNGVWAAIMASLLEDNCAMMPLNELRNFRMYCRARSIKVSSRVQPEGDYLVWIPKTINQ